MTDNNRSEIEILIKPHGSGFAEAASKPAKQIRDALPLLGEALKQPIDDLFAAMTTGMRQPPDEIELQLGLSFEGGASWAVVSVGAEATLTLTLKVKPGERAKASLGTDNS